MTSRKYDHVIQLPQTAQVDSAVDARKVAQEWLSKLEGIFATGNFSRVGKFSTKTHGGATSLLCSGIFAPFEVGSQLEYSSTKTSS